MKIDTGSEPNLLKIGFLVDPDSINLKERLRLLGTTTEYVTILGSVYIRIAGISVLFHLVDNDFPISQAGILGTDIFSAYKAKIDYKL